jgi:intracellular septation protein
MSKPGISQSATSAAADGSSSRKALFERLAAEAGPPAGFFIAYYAWGIWTAMAVLMALTVASVVWGIRQSGRLPTFPLLGMAVVLACGAVAFFVGQELFIKIQPTVANAIFGATILAGPLLGLNPLEHAFKDELTLSRRDWRVLAWRTGAFLLLLGGLNELVWRTCSTEIWVWFKLLGVLPLDAAFVASQWHIVRRGQREG